MEFIVMASSLKIRDHKKFWKKQFRDPTSIEDELLTPVEIREYLDREMVQGLVAALQGWLNTGRLDA